MQAIEAAEAGFGHDIFVGACCKYPLHSRRGSFRSENPRADFDGEPGFHPDFDWGLVNDMRKKPTMEELGIKPWPEAELLDDFL